MNSRRIYQQLIERATARGAVVGEYFETHHILPRSMGGADDKSNLVQLTAREHYIAHWLLFRIHRNAKMASAWFFMHFHSSGHRYSGRAYEYARKAKSQSQIGTNLSDGHRRRIGESLKGRPTTDRQREATKEANKLRKWSDESRRKASEARKGVFVRGSHARARKVIDLDSGEVFQCMTDMAESIGVTKAAIQNAITRGNRCKGRRLAYL